MPPPVQYVDQISILRNVARIFATVRDVIGTATVNVKNKKHPREYNPNVFVFFLGSIWGIKPKYGGGDPCKIERRR